MLYYKPEERIIIPEIINHEAFKLKPEGLSKQLYSRDQKIDFEELIKFYQKAEY